MKILFTLLSSIIVLIAGAQELPPFKTLRYEEDYSFLKNDTAPSTYSKIKFQPLSKNGNSYNSLGGEIRYQYFNITNEDWGKSNRGSDGFLFSRFLLHNDFHAGKNFRFFTQLQGSMANGKTSGTTPVDENPLDFHQLFIDVNTNSKKFILRLGRQELGYSSQRLVSVRELPNNRQAFDVVKAIFTFKNVKADAFYSRYVQPQKGLFDDLSDRNINFWGLYLVSNNVPLFKNIDLYYFGLSKREAEFDAGSGHERRHTIGTRMFDTIKGWRYDFEGAYQFGDFTSNRIAAWTLSSNTSYKFTGAPLKPEVGVKTEIITGDRRSGDNKMQTFNPLFPRGAYFGLAALIGPVNLVDVHPSVILNLADKKLAWTIDYDIFWRHSLQDGIYTPNVTLIFPSGRSAKRLIGKQLATDFTFTPNSFIMFRMEGTWFNAGPYLKDVSPGKDILYFGVTSQLKF